MTTYVYRNGVAVSKDTGEPMLSPDEVKRKPSAPQIMGFTPYACPITGKEIRTLSQHNANLKKHNCVEYNELKSPTGGEIRNANFAKKRGLDVSERYKDEPFERKSNER